MSKIVCVYHNIDLDGFMSAAIVKLWWLTNNKYSFIQECNNNGDCINSICYKEDVFNKEDKIYPILDFVGYNYGQPIPDLSEYDKVIMCDISFPKEIMNKLYWEFRENFIWNDHHLSAIKDCLDYSYSKSKGIRSTSFAACELTWIYFFPNEPIPEIVRLLGRYDCFGHKGTEEETKVLEFQYGARTFISNYEDAYRYLQTYFDREKDKDENNELINSIWTIGSGIYKYLCTEAKQVYKNGFEITLSEYRDETCSEERLHKFICINKERFNPINFDIDYHKDGYDGAACFHYANGIYNFSLYNGNGLVDCSIIAKQFGGGGHKSAAGFRLNQEQFNNLIK